MTRLRGPVPRLTPWAPFTSHLGLSRWRHALMTIRNTAHAQGDRELYVIMCARIVLATQYLKRLTRAERNIP